MTREELKQKIRGNIVPLPAQFNDDLSLNFDGFKDHIAFLLENGVEIIYLGLAASEFRYMTLEERLKVTEFTVKEINGKAIVFSQVVGGGCEGDFISEAKAMAGIGVDALVIKPIDIEEDQKFFSSSYRRKTYSSNQEELDKDIVGFFENISKCTGASIIFHDKPFRSFELVDNVLSLENMIGLKTHESDPWKRQEIYRRYGEKVVCFDGLGKTDQFWSLSWGAKARHTCWSWFDPKRDQKFVDLIEQGNIKEARDLVNEEWEFVNAILSTGFHGYKIAMELVGLPAGPVRIPGGNVGLSKKDMIKKAMIGMGYDIKAR